MDEAKLAEALDTLTTTEIRNAADALNAYASHREAFVPPGVQQAPFNWQKFVENVGKVFGAVQKIWPIVAPLIGAAPK